MPVVALLVPSLNPVSAAMQWGFVTLTEILPPLFHHQLQPGAHNLSNSVIPFICFQCPSSICRALSFIAVFETNMCCRDRVIVNVVTANSVDRLPIQSSTRQVTFRIGSQERSYLC